MSPLIILSEHASHPNILHQVMTLTLTAHLKEKKTTIIFFLSFLLVTATNQTDTQKKDKNKKLGVATKMRHCHIITLHLMDILTIKKVFLILSKKLVLIIYSIDKVIENFWGVWHEKSQYYSSEKAYR